MALKIRLSRGGAKKKPFYRIVVAEATSPRDGKFVEKITGVENTALWSEVIGIVLGCILGIFIPKLIKNSTVNVDVDVKLKTD